MAIRDNKTYLPRIKVAPTPDSGVSIVDAGDTIKPVLVLLAVALFWNGISWAAMTGALIEAEWVAVAFLCIFVIIGFVLFVMTFKKWLLYRRLTPGVLEVRPWPLHLGRSANITYKRQPRKSMKLRYVEARVQLAEEVRYNQGTQVHSDERTVTSVALERKALGGGDPRLGIEQSWTFDVPDDQPPSFEAPRNALRWKVVVDLYYGSSDHDDSTFEVLVVAPESGVEAV